MAEDPLDGHKAASDFLNDLLSPAAQDVEVEKASGGELSPAAQVLHDRCIAGDGDEQACMALAQDFDQWNPGGFQLGEGGEDTEDDSMSKDISTVGMASDMGEPSATIALTDVGRKRRLHV